jgi:hypothetical protein
MTKILNKTLNGTWLSYEFNSKKQLRKWEESKLMERKQRHRDNVNNYKR